MEAHADVEDYCVLELYRDCWPSLANGNILHTIRSWKVCVMLIVYELFSTGLNPYVDMLNSPFKFKTIL